MQKGGRFSPYGGGGGKGKEPEEGRMILVTNLPPTAEWQEVKDHMGQAGMVEFADVVGDEYGNSTCTACVRFASAAQAQAAITLLNGSIVAGKQGKGGDSVIGVDFWTGPRPATSVKGPLRPSFSGEPDEGRMIKVSNVPFSAEWQEVKDHMGMAGTVEFVSVLADEMGNKKGEAFIRYASAMEAELAITSLNGSSMSGKLGKGGPSEIKVEYWTGPKPSTAKGKMGVVGGPAKGGMSREQMEMMQGYVIGQMMRQKGYSSTIGDVSDMMSMFGGGKGFGKGSGGGKKGGKNEPAKKVRVTGLPNGVQWQELKDHMNNAGPVEFCNVVGMVGEVRYGTPALAQEAIGLLNGSWMQSGGPITVEQWE